MARMFLMCGCSGSGKTTFAKQYAKEYNLLYLGIDEFYAKINGDECMHTNTFEVWMAYYRAIHEAEINNIDCIVDTNALTRGQREQFIEWFPTFEHHLIVILTSPDLRRRNNKSRRRQVPEEVMAEMEKKFTMPFPSHESPKWITIRTITNIANSFGTPFYLKGDKNDLC